MSSVFEEFIKNILKEVRLLADKADIGAKIEIDGEKQYRDSLKAIDSELKAMRSEMDLAAASMDDMADSEEKNAK